MAKRITIYGDPNTVLYAEYAETADVSEGGVCFVPIDLSYITTVRDYFEEKLINLDVDEAKRFDLTLVVDELVSNAIMASSESGKTETVIFRWQKLDEIVELGVLDYGGGLNIAEISKVLPRGKSFNEFLQSLHRYREETVIEVKNKDKLVKHFKFGHGLKIIMGLTDELRFTFHDSDGIFSEHWQENTQGTFVQVKYNLSKNISY